MWWFLNHAVFSLFLKKGTNGCLTCILFFFFHSYNIKGKNFSNLSFFPWIMDKYLDFSTKYYLLWHFQCMVIQLQTVSKIGLRKCRLQNSSHFRGAGGGGGGVELSEHLPHGLNTVTIKTPNPKCRFYWCLQCVTVCREGFIFLPCNN